MTSERQNRKYSLISAADKETKSDWTKEETSLPD